MSRRHPSNPPGAHTRAKEVRFVPHAGPRLGRAVVLTSLVIATVALLSFISVRALSQTESQSADVSIAESKVKPDAPGTIDGAKNPVLIPDEVALRMLVLSVAEPPDANEEQITRARAKLAPIGLGEEDTAALLTHLADFRAQAEEIDKQAADVYVRAPFPHPNSTDYQRLVDLGTQQIQLANNAVAALPARLSKEGLVKLQLYLPEAKKSMKMTHESLMSK
jgi:hypothetical protein